MNHEIFAAIGEALTKGEEVALVTIVSSNGSTPQRVGAKMLVFADGRTVGTIGGGSAFWPPALIARLREELPQASVSTGYGMTETSAPIPVPDRRHGTPPGSVGRLAPSTELRVVDPETGEDRGPGGRGELWVRGPQVMLGYLNNQQATDETLDAEGWLHTGDVAMVDAEGRYSVVDRVKELIKYKGYQVAPAELEAVLLSSPDVADAAVIGVTDERGEEVPKAFVVRAPGSSATEDDVMAFVAERTAPYKRVRQLEFIEAVPKSASGSPQNMRSPSTIPPIRASPAAGRSTRMLPGHRSKWTRTGTVTSSSAPAAVRITAAASSTGRGSRGEASATSTRTRPSGSRKMRVWQRRPGTCRTTLAISSVRASSAASATSSRPQPVRYSRRMRRR